MIGIGTWKIVEGETLLNYWPYRGYANALHRNFLHFFKFAAKGSPFS